MQIGIPITLNVMSEIEPQQALEILCQTLNMEFVLDDSVNYYIRQDRNGAYRVLMNNGEDEVIVDDRGSLFMALRQVASCLADPIGKEVAE